MANIDSVKLPDGSEYGIASGGSNPNLLINPWFTVNQRGWTSGTLVSNKYCVDRWKMNSMSGTATITATSGGLQVTLGANSARPIILQPIENTSDFVGKTFTFSAKVIIGGTEKIVYGTETVPSGNTRTAFYSDANIVLSYFGDLSAFVCEVTQFSNTATIVALKVEKGSTSTLHLDTAPDYSIELMKCQRYYRLLGTAGAQICLLDVYNTTDAYAPIFLTCPMRTTPTLEYTDISDLRLVTHGSVIAATSATVYQGNDSNSCYIKLTASGLTPYCSGRLLVYYHPLALDAEL